MEQIMIVMGTRPEAIKLCPVVRELQKRGRYEVRVCSTGQHRAMLDHALKAFSIKPDFDLNVMRNGQTLSDTLSQMLHGLEELFRKSKPSMVLVQGDTATAFAGALAAFYNHIPVGHIEAGLRTHHMDSPFPEEFHRTAISYLSTLHFAPTVTAKKNLLKEGRADSKIFITGNTVVDALRYTLTECRPSTPWKLPSDARMVLFTAHRRESFGKPMQGMFRALRRLVELYPDVIAVCPLHPNPAVREAAKVSLCGHPRIFTVEPPETVTFHHLMAGAYLILTDSGGIQEEAVTLGIPTMVTRFSTERTEGLQSGVLRLAGSGEEGIFELGKRLLEPGNEEYEAMRKPSKIFGDGFAARRIADALEKII